MSAFDEAFDAKEWIAEHGLPREGRSLKLRLDTRLLDATVQIPSCAAWSLPELGVGQGHWDQHQGYRGTLSGLLERARQDVERNQGLYGDAAKPKFQAVLKLIDLLLHGEDGALDAVSLSVHDPSGLCVVPAELSSCIVEDQRFDRSMAQTMMLTPKEFAMPEERLSNPEGVAKLVCQSKSIVALTGAGISVESGITPFRNPSADDSGSLWGTFDAARMTVQNFNRDPGVVQSAWDMDRKLTDEIRRASANPAHKFFALLEQRGKLEAVVTQNIDSLHQDGGVSAEKVIELHGHMRGLICSDHLTDLNPLPFRGGGCTFCISERESDTLAALHRKVEAPICPRCDCPLRRQTVMFGQPMPELPVEAACAAMDAADLVFIVGSTLVVQPANELPRVALRNGVPIVIVNFDDTQYDIYATGLFREKAGEFLGAVSKLLAQLPQGTARTPPPCKARPLRTEQSKQARVESEGRRCGKEIAVSARSCNMVCFCTAVAEPEGDFALLKQSLVAMNRECADIGKMIFSAGLAQLAVVAFVPPARVNAVSSKAWLQAVAQAIGGEILEEEDGDEEGTWARLVVVAGPDTHPIKLKEPGITAAIRFLKEKGLFPEEEDSDDDIIYGDEDFPS